ncbi:MAG: hypothetical protein ABMA02_06640, partial [Saprospiraceae bacterium]
SVTLFFTFSTEAGMVNTFVYEVLETFSPEENESFRAFLDSPYFNKGRHADEIKVLFQVFESARKASNPEDTLTKARVFEAIFPNSAVVKGKLDKLISEFKKLLQTFLLTQRYLNHREEQGQVLDFAVEMRLRGLEGKYLQALEKTQEMIACTESESLTNYLFRLHVALEEHEWHSTYNKAKGDLGIPDVLFHLDRYYYAQRLEMLNRLLLQQKLTILPESSLVPTQELWEIPKAFQNSGSLLPITWRIHAILNASVPVVSDFEELLDTLRSQEPHISPKHLQEFYAYIRGVCTFLIDAGHDELRPTLFQIQKDNLVRGYFYYDGKISSNSALSITRSALDLHDISWANAFVDSHKGLIIGENETQDFYRMNKALCLFGEKKYDAALEIIPFGSSFSFYQLQARGLELKIYFELGSELLPYKIDAFKMFISRAGDKLLSKDRHERFANFINFVRQLSLSPKTMDAVRSEQLIRRINAKKLVAERSWLIEKARSFREWRY